MAKIREARTLVWEADDGSSGSITGDPTATKATLEEKLGISLPDPEWDAQEAAKVAGRDGLANLPGWATWTATEAEDWIQTNVTDLTSAKTALKAMAKAIVYLRNQEMGK